MRTGNIQKKKSVSFGGTRLLPDNAKSFLSNPRSDLKQSLLSNEYEMTTGKGDDNRPSMSSDPSIVLSDISSINSFDASKSIVHDQEIKYDVDLDDIDDDDKNKFALKRAKKVRKIIREGYEWDVCLVLPNIADEEYRDLPFREGYISMFYVV